MLFAGRATWCSMQIIETNRATSRSHSQPRRYAAAPASLGRVLADFLIERLKPSFYATVMCATIMIYARDHGVAGSAILIRTCCGQSPVAGVTEFLSGTEDGENLLTAYKRAANILKKRIGSGRRS